LEVAVLSGHLPASELLGLNLTVAVATAVASVALITVNQQTSNRIQDREGGQNGK